MSMVKAVFYCKTCGCQISGVPSSEPRNQEEIDEIVALAKSDHQHDAGHPWPEGEAELVKVEASEIGKSYVPSVSELPQSNKRRPKTSLPADASGTHRGPTHGHTPRLTVINTDPEDRDVASVRDRSDSSNRSKIATGK